MNKYIKKCLIVYSSLALILVGMAGAAYAVTASDADNYVTRSQFATDMTYLQARLDEKESNLMGDINKYRTTDIKFTTFDTPDYEGAPAATYGGHYTGGNFFPRRKTTTSNNAWQFGAFPDLAARKDCMYEIYYLYRLWNGNYYITQDFTFREGIDDTGNPWYACHRCAVPIENLPGWYLVFGLYGQGPWQTRSLTSLLKLDPNVGYDLPAATIQNMELVIRFKKDLWQLAGDRTGAWPINETGISSTSVSYYQNATYAGPFASVFRADGGETATGTQTIYFRSHTDPETGDYITKLRGVIPSRPGYEVTMNFGFGGSTGTPNICNLIPKDNVEYLMGPLASAYLFTGSYVSNYAMAVPRGDRIGTKQYNDIAWEYEFVDCVNGLTYWHAHAKPRKENYSNGTIGRVYGFNYSLPIVY